jgi:pSer/pThr/pTyr-binding forkhead associated (FHA) protein
MSYRLQVKGAQGEREVLLVDSLAVGRDPRCDISATDPLLSRRHAEFVASGPRVLVRDLGSRNGILVNGRRLPEAVLSPGDVVQIAQFVVTFVSSVEAPTAVAPGAIDEKTALLDEGRIKEVAAASSSTATSGSSGGAGSDSASHQAGWSVQLPAHDDRTSMLPPPAAPAFDPLAGPLPATRESLPIAPVPAAAETILARGEATSAWRPERRRSTFAGVAVPVLTLAIFCLACGVGSTWWWLQASLPAGERFVQHAPAAVVGAFFVAVAAGMVTAVAVHRVMSRDSRNEVPAAGQRQTRG